MPIYCYSNKSGQVIEKHFPVGKAPEMLKGGYERDFGLEGATVPPTKGWPMECLGSGVNAEQRQELGTYLRDRGVDTFVLEVIKDNEPAIRAYRKAGFEVNREFKCFELQVADLRGGPSDTDSSQIRPVDRQVVSSLAECADWPPSWENSFAAIHRIQDELIVVGGSSPIPHSAMLIK